MSNLVAVVLLKAQIVCGASRKEGETVEVDQKSAKYLVGHGRAKYPEGEADDGDLVDLDKLTVEELKAEAEARELKTTGNKAELIARIEEHDASE